MSEILLRWLNDEVHLRNPVVDFESDFSNGYAFGELLDKHEMQPDFHLFIDGDHPDAKTNNFVLLEPTLRTLGVKFDSRSASQIMVGQPGAAQKLLYQVMVAVRGFERNVLGNDPAARTVKVGGNALATLQTNATKQDKHDSKMHDIFEQRLRELSENPNNIMTAMVTQRFEEEMLRQHEQATDGAMAALSNTVDHRQGMRQAALESLRRNHDFLADWEEKGRIEHAENQRRQREVEQAELRYELAMKEKRARRFREGNTRAAHAMTSGIDEFEKTLARIGADAGGGEDLVPAVDSEASPAVHLSTLKTMLPHRKAMEEEARQYLGKVKEKKAEEVYARKERERRRRKAMLEQQHTQAAMEQKRREQLLAEKLLKQSAQERRLGERLAQTRLHKEVIKENRLMREQQYAAQRQKDYDEVLARDAELGKQKRSEAEHEVALERERREEAEAARQAEKKVQRTELCHDILTQAVDLALHVCDQRALSGGPMAPKEWREVKLLFVKGQRLLEEGDGWGEAVEDVEPTDETTLVLDEQALSDYLQDTGEWAAPPGGGSNAVLGKILQDIDLTVNPPVDKTRPEKLPQGHLKVVMTGKPFSGKSLQAAKLCDAYGLISIEPLQLMAAITAEDWEPFVAEDEEKGLPPLEAEANELAEKLAEELATADGASDETLARLVALEIRKLTFDQEWVAPEPVESAEGEDPPAEPAPGQWMLKWKPEDEIGAGGWVLESFPTTPAQAELLEAQLSGIDQAEVDGPPPETGVRAMIAPAPDAPERPPLISAVDVVLRFDVPDEIVTERAAGRRVDPETGAIYHLVNNPPPEDEALKERLQTIDDASNDEAQLLHRCQTFRDQEPAMEEWFATFLTLQAVDASADEQAVEATIAEVLQAIVDKKNAPPEPDPAEAEAEAEAEADTEAPAEAEAEAEAEADAEPAAEGTEDEGAAEGAAEGDDKDEGEPAAEQAAAEPEPREARDLTLELAKILQGQWERIESEFQKRVKRAFRAIRTERGATVERVAELSKFFLDFVRRPDDKTSIVEDWQAKFNALPIEMRADNETKAELHLRAEELRDQLWEICDNRKAECESTKDSVASDMWVRDHARVLEELMVTVLQAEVDRYTRTKAIITDYYSERGDDDPTIAAIADRVEAVRAPAVSEGEEEAAPEGDEDEAAEQELCPNMLAAFNKAMSVVNPPAEEPSDEDAGGKKGKKEEEEEEEPEPPLPNLLATEMEEALATEDKIFSARAEKLLAQCRSFVQDMQTMENGAIEKMNGLTGERFKAEVGAVKALIEYVGGVIEQGSELHYRLELLSEDFIVDEEALMAELPKPPPPPPVIEPAHENTFTIDQLNTLWAHLQTLTAGATTAPAEQVGAMLGGLCQLPENVPLSWVGSDAAKMTNIARGGSTDSVLDIRQVLVSLALASVSTPSKQDVSDFVSGLGDGPVDKESFCSASWWFNGDDTNADAGFPRIALLKETVLFEALKDAEDLVSVPLLKGMLEGSLKAAAAAVAAAKVEKAAQKRLARAKKKFDAADADSSGSLEGDELEELAMWVFKALNPEDKEQEQGEETLEEMSEVEKQEAVAKLVDEADENNDGKVDFEEFSKWYTATCVKIATFRRELAQSKK